MIVIGNGMAGARTVEEILTRGGADQFETTVVGEEAYGTYNRLSRSGCDGQNQVDTSCLCRSAEKRDQELPSIGHQRRKRRISRVDHWQSDFAQYQSRLSVSERVATSQARPTTRRALAKIREKDFPTVRKGIFFRSNFLWFVLFAVYVVRTFWTS
jgi:hypothetical protein